MCGIAGIWGNDAAMDSVEQMVGKMIHRGPDGAGAHVDAQASLSFGHCRLAIMDPAGGAQPLYSEDGSLVLIANSEIYNSRDLRDALTPEHRFATRTDSETILHLFEDLGQAAALELDGMFAFALSDGDAFYLARDPIGIKPLYYSRQDAGNGEETLVFASEIKALADDFDVVNEFPAGSYYSSDAGFVRYYDVPELTIADLPAAEHIRRLRRTLEEAVTKRLMSDVPLGAFLSGGLDSSIIAAIARQHMDELHTFSVGVEGSRDVEAARQVAAHIDSVHHEYLYTIDEVRQCLPEVIYYLESFDQDLVRSAIPCYLCSRLAADHVKVILTGEGADELFAGYSYYKHILSPERLHAELQRSVRNLHNMNLQRVDRLTMCHGIEGRVPFLDTVLVDLAQTIPPQLKLRTTRTGQPIEKWILRKAFEDLLPPEIVWRDKEQFDEGSGTVDLLTAALDAATQSLDVSAYRAQHPDQRLRSAEECYYHKLLCQAYANPGPVLDNVARWHAGRLH